MMTQQHLNAGGMMQRDDALMASYESQMDRRQQQAASDMQGMVQGIVQGELQGLKRKLDDTLGELKRSQEITQVSQGRMEMAQKESVETAARIEAELASQRAEHLAGQLAVRRDLAEMRRIQAVQLKQQHQGLESVVHVMGRMGTTLVEKLKVRPDAKMLGTLITEFAATLSKTERRVKDMEKTTVAAAKADPDSQQELTALEDSVRKSQEVAQELAEGLNELRRQPEVQNMLGQGDMDTINALLTASTNFRQQGNGNGSGGFEGGEGSTPSTVDAPGAEKSGTPTPPGVGNAPEMTPEQTAAFGSPKATPVGSSGEDPRRRETEHPGTTEGAAPKAATAAGSGGGVMRMAARKPATNLKEASPIAAIFGSRK